jgi:flagellar basal-body rod protein FlgC
MPIDALFNTIKISGTGTRAQRLRMDTIASNLANINSTRTAEGGPYKRKAPVFEEVFDQTLESELDPKRDVFNGVMVTGVVPSQNCFKQVYDPGHPDANDDGYLTVPNISSMEEMVNLIDSSRAYEANLSVSRNTRRMINDTIALLRRS